MEESQKKKIIIIQIVAAVLAGFIFIFWMINLKNVWETEKSLSSSDNNQEWLDLKNDLDKAVSDIKDGLDQVKQAKNAQDNAKQEALLADVLSETKKIASTSDAIVVPVVLTPASSTTPAATSTNANTFCPAYINCMPRIGETPPSCQVPAACEGITVIAY